MLRLEKKAGQPAEADQLVYPVRVANFLGEVTFTSGLQIIWAQSPNLLDMVESNLVLYHFQIIRRFGFLHIYRFKYISRQVYI